MVQINSVARTFLFIVFLVTSLAGRADVKFRFSAGTISDGTLKTRMENNISVLLTEINRAATTGTALNLSGVNMEAAAKKRLDALWDDVRFICDKSVNISKCLNDMQGYQVRSIPITMKPYDASYTQSLNRELTISLNKSGVITGVRPAWEIHEDVATIMNSGQGVSDTRQRREILKWVEDFRCYYNEQDTAALRQIYSDDALIITGSVINRRETHGDRGNQIVRQVKYKVQSKDQYLDNLFKNVFGPRKKINVEFDHISVVRSGSKEHIYGVTLHQKWRSGTYSDEGWLFLLWDFKDPEQPQIHVRTWQPEQAVAQDGVFSIDDFFIP